jgi:hypothetical protein
MQLKTFEKMRSDYVADLPNSRPRTAADFVGSSFDQAYPSHEASQASAFAFPSMAQRMKPHQP